MNFNPILSGKDFGAFASGNTPTDIQTERDYISWATSIVLVYPVWWIGRPAIMQGYFDRVLGFNFAFTVDQNGARGLLKTEKAIVINTAGTPEFIYDAWPASKDLISRPVSEGVLGFCGITNVKMLTFFGIAGSTDEQRATILEEIKSEIASL